MLIEKVICAASVLLVAFAGPVRAELDRYGVLIGRPVSNYLEPVAGEGRWPHYVVNVQTPAGLQRAVINVFSRADEQVLHREVKMEPFALRDPLGGTSKFTQYNGVFDKPDGVHLLPFNSQSGAATGGALDYLRHSDLIADTRNTPWSSVPLVVGGTSVPLWDSLLKNARRVYIFGEPYSNSDGTKGVHDVHQNQGNLATSGFALHDGRWQDGGMIVEYDPTPTWIPSTCGFVPMCSGGYWLSVPSRVLVVTRFQVQMDFSDKNGHGVAPTLVSYSGDGAASDGWVDYGPFWAGQLQVELDTLSGNPDVYLQTDMPAGEWSFRVRSMGVAGANEYIRDFVPSKWTYVRVKANGTPSQWNVRFKYLGP